MPVTADTTIYDLVGEYPYLLDWLVDYDSHFTALKNPALFKTMARVAKIETAASMANVDAYMLLDDIRTEIATHEIGAEEAADAPAAPVDPEAAARAAGGAEGHYPQAARRNACRAGQGRVRPSDSGCRLGRDRAHGAGADCRGTAHGRRATTVRRAREGVQGGARREAFGGGRGGSPHRRIHTRERGRHPAGGRREPAARRIGDRHRPCRPRCRALRHLGKARRARSD